MEINLKNEINPVYFQLLSNINRYEVLYGGGGSGKSYFTAQKQLIRIITEKGHKILVVRKIARTIRGSCYALLRDVILSWGIYHKFEFNKTEMSIKFKANGNEIVTAGMDDPEKIKSIHGITSIWVEEATELRKEDFMQLDIRLRGQTKHHKQIMLTFNPVSSQNWLYKHFFSNPSTDIKNKSTVLKTTYKDNMKLDAEYAGVLESLAEQDENYYNVYALGLWGQLAELIYKPFPIINNYPKFFTDTFYGLDFGFVNPTALIRIDRRENEFYLTESLYQTRLTNTELIQKLKDLEISKNHPIYADAAEPQRIQEIHNAGFMVLPADKSVKDGIDHVKRQKIYSNPNNTNINNEVLGYAYRKDKDGNILEEPIKFKDHTMDAIRYGIHTHLKYVTEFAEQNPDNMDFDNLIKLSDAFMELKYRFLKEEASENEIDEKIIKELQLSKANYDKLKKYIKKTYEY